MCTFSHFDLARKIEVKVFEVLNKTVTFLSNGFDGNAIFEPKLEEEVNFKQLILEESARGT